MSYIGKTPATGNFVKLDAITTSSTNTYNLLKDSVAFTPESANHMIVSLNGVIQAPSTAFSVSGSQITFIPASGTLSSSDTIDFILVLGNVLDIGTPSDDTISASKLQTDSVIEAKIQNDAVTRDKINAISTSSSPSFEAKGTSGDTDGYIQLNCELNTHGIKLKSPPHSAGQSYTLTFPSTAPATDKFLQTNSSGVLSFADAGGTIVKLASGTFSNNSLSFNGYFSSDYSHYKIILTDVVPAANNYDISMRYRISDADVTTSDYNNVGQHGAIQMGVSSTDGTSNQTNTDKFILQQGYAVSNASNLCLNAELTIFNPLSTSLYKHYHYKSSCHYSSETGYWVTSTGGGYYDANTTALSGFTIFSSAGNIASGNVYLYGVKA